MNKSYKSIWNETLGTYVAAAEISTSSGRKVSSARKSRRAPERAHSTQIALEQRIVFDAAMPATVIETQASVAPVDTVVLEDLDKPEAEEPQADVPVAGTQVPEATVSSPSTEVAATQSSEEEEVGAGDAAEVVEVGAEEEDVVEAPAAPSEAVAVEPVATVETPVVEVAPTESDVATVEADATEERVEIIFVDAVVADVANELNWHSGEIYVLDANRDGVEQMAEILNGRTGIDAIHIISHGTPGRLELGNTTLDATSMAGEHADELAAIRAALSDDADLLLYGCDVSSTSAGVAFVEALAEATGADVAASDDDTGEAALGGDWVLETQVGGNIETVVITVAQMAGLLTTAVNTGAGAFLGVEGMTIYSIDITTGKATPLTTVPASVGGVTLVGGLLNSLAVDQANGLIYYMSNEGAASNVALFAYNFNTNTHILIDADLTDNGVVVGARGLGSGAAVFANGALYIGVENNLGGDGAGTVADDTIYRLVLSSNGLSVISGAALVLNIVGNDWGDMSYDVATNTLQSSSLNGAQTAVNMTRYSLNAGGTTVTATNTVTVATTQSQGAQSLAGGTYLLGTSIQQYNPVTGALIGSAVAITTNGTTPLASSLSDAASWTPPTATLGDRVFTDTNANGTFDGTDSGIAGVTVRLVDDVNNNGIVDAGERVLATDITNANGEYMFTGALPGNYIVQVTDTGGVLGVGRVYTTAGGATNANGDITQIGASNLTLDFGLNNRPPVNVVPGAQTIAEDSTLVITGVSASDPDGNLSTTQLTVTNGTLNVNLAGGATISAGANGSGTLTLSGTAAQINAALASINYQPTANYFGPAVLTVRSTDVAGLQDTDTVNITVSAFNDPPVDGNETNTVTEDTTLTVANGAPGDLLNNVTDVDGGTPTITQFVVNGNTLTAGQTATLPGVGALTINANGSYSFVPELNYTGAIPVATYTVSDGAGGTDTSTLTLVMAPVNDPPVDGNETNTVTEDTTLTVADGSPADLLANATDVDGNPLTITQFVVSGNTLTAGQTATLPGVGALTINANGSYSFVPVLNYTGAIPVATYTVSDGAGGTDTSTLTLVMAPVNDPPVDGNETNSVTEDTTLTVADGAGGDLLNNSTDVDGGAPTITDFTVNGNTLTAGQTATLPGVGALTINANGSYSFVPELNYTGAIPVATYTVSDGAGGTDTSTLTLVMAPVNDPPVDGNETNTVTEDTTLTVADGSPADLLANATDVDGNPLTITQFVVSGNTLTAGQTATLPGVGALTINANGSYSFVPELNYTGAIPVATYTVSDGAGGTDTSTLTLVMAPVNDPPVDGNETNTVTEDTTLTVADGAGGDLLNNSTDVDGGAPTITQFVVNGNTLTAGQTATLPGVGALTINANGSYSFVPELNYTGAIPVATYTVSDGAGGTDTSTLTLVMAPVNDPPVDGNETNTVTEDTTLTVADGSPADLLANATDVDGNPLTITQFVVSGNTLTAGQTATLPGVGALTINANGSYSFVPELNYTGAIPVATYTVSDGAGGTDTSTLTLVMAPVNDPPVDGNETNTVTEDTTLTVADGAGGDLLNNSTDVDGGAPTITQFVVNGNTLTAGQTATLPGVGALTINANGSYSFVPELNYTGAIPVATYTVSDGAGGTDTSTLTLVMAPVNDPPVDGNETNTVTEDTTLTVADGSPADLLANATDVDGNPLTITQFVVSGNTLTAGQTATLPGVGALTINANGSYSFVPELNYTGAIPVATYTVSDGAGGTDTSTLTLVMAPVNDPPVDGNETNTVTEDTTLTVADGAGGDLLNNSTDVDGGAPTITQFVVNGNTLTAGQTATLPGVGALTINANGSYSFVPELNYTGAIPVATYTVSDGAGGTDTSTLTLVMAPVNDPPVDGNETNTVTEDTTLTVADGSPADLLANATDVDGNPLTITQFVVNGNTLTAGQTATLPGVGALTINANGSYSFVPVLNYTGAIPVATYTVSDGAGGTDTSTLTLVMAPVNDPPDAVDDSQAVAPGTPTTLTLLANDSDVDGDSPLTVTTATLVNPALGTLTNVGGVWTFTSAPGVSGPVVINYTISDPTGATDSATHTVNVGNQPPVLTDPDPTPGTPEVDPGNPTNLLVPAVDNVPVAVDLDSYFTDPNTGDVLSFTPNLTGLPAWVTYDPVTHVLGGTPPVDNTGTPVVVPVTVSDGQGGTFTGTITITPVNPGPDAVNDTQAVVPGVATAVTLLANDTDPDGDPLTVTTATLVNPALGTLTNVGGVWTFTSAPGVSGPVVINYTIVDQDGATDSATHTVNVGNQPPVLTDPDPTPGTPEVDPGNPTNLLVPAVDNVPVAVDLDSYFTDPNTGDVLSFTPNLTGLPAWVTYDPVTHVLGGTPPVDNTGTPVVVPVTVSDGQGGTFTGTITITPVNPGPDAVNDTQAVVPGVATAVTLLANDTDPDGDPLTVTTATLVNPALGTLTNVGGVWTFTSAPGVSGPVVINYTIVDQDGATDSATHTVNVGNQPPVLTDPDPTPGTPEVDPGNPTNLLVPAVDNVPVAVDLDSYFTDPNTGDVLSFTPNLTGLPAWVTYDPVTHVLGGTPPVDNTGTPVVVPVTVSDGQGGTFTGTITITPVNPGPDAVNDTQAVVPGVATAVTLLANDTDPDGDPLTVTTATLVNPALGTLTNVGGVWTFTSAPGVSGPVVINYTIVDQDGATDSATHTVNVANQPPVLTDPDPTPGTPEVDPGNPTNLLVPAVDNVPVAVDLDSYFTDPNTGDVLSFTPNLTGLPAWVTYDPVTHVLGGTPPVDNTGTPVVVPVTVSDGQGGTFTGTITITPVNPGPDAVNDTQAVVPGVATAVTLLANDTDPDGDPLTVTTATLVNPALGTLTNVGGVWTFTSAPGVSGPVVINYTIVDQDGATDSATHTVNVGNQPPVLTDPDPTPGTPEVDPGNPTNLLVPAVDNVPVAVDLDSYFTDPNTGDVLSFTPNLTGLPAWVTYDPVTHVLGGTPPVDNTGTPVVVPVTVSDGQGGTFTGTITITPVNPGPDAVNDTQAVVPGVATAVTLLANDTDPDGDPLTVTTATLVNPALGTLTNVGGVWTFTSAPGVSGPVVINYTIVDQDGATDSATHTVNVANQPPVLTDPDPTPGTPEVDPGNPTNLLVPAVDNVPVAVDLDSYFTDPNTGDVLSFTPNLTGLPAWVTYDPVTHVLGGTPPVDNTGTPVVVPVTVSDGQGGTFTGTITITPVNPGPDAVNDTQAVVPGVATAVTLLANDTDPDGDPLTVTTATLVNPALGTLTNVGGVWTFTSAPGVSGPVVINYTIVDQDGATDSATHTVNVGNQPPVLTDPDPTPGTPEVDPGNPTNLLVPAVDNVPVAVDLDSYFTDPNTGDVLSFTPNLTGLPAWVTYDPVTHVLGGTPPVDNTGTPVVVPVTVSDGQGGTFTGTITITPVNPGPDAVNDTQAVVPGVATAVTLLANDTDPDGDPLTVTTATLVNPALGTLTNVGGVWTFTSAPGVSGPVVINYTIVDQDGATDSATHTVNVANQPPVLTDPDPTPGTPEVDPGNPTNLLVPAVDNVPVAVDLDSYFTDPNTGDVLSFTPNLTGLPAWVTYDPVTHVLGGTPPVDNTGTPVVVPVTVSDGQGGTFTGTITITPVNPGPDAVNDTQAVVPGVATAVTLLANDTDPDGDPLTVTTATLVNPALGTLTNVGGVWTFTSAPGVSGPVVINYTIVDQDGATDSATHTVNVGNQPPVLTDPDPTPGTPEVDPGNPTNLLVPAVDNVPVAVDLDSYFTDPNTGDVLSFTPNLTGLPAWVTYDPVTHVLGGTPPVDNTGTPVVVPVTVSDGQGGTFTGTITITPVNPGPDAVNDTQAVVPGVATAVTLLANDTDPDGDPLTVTTATLVNPALGTLTNVGGVWTFTSAPGVSGPVVINYTIVDQDGATDSATHTVNVANQPPVLTDPDPTPGTPEVDPGNPTNLLVPAVDNVPVAVDLDSYFTDPNTGDVLSFTPNLTGLPAWVTYDPVTHVLGGTPPVDNTGTPVVVPVTVSDGQGGTFTGTITITPVNPGPDAVNDTQAVVPGVATAVTLLANDTDPDGDPLTVTTATLVNPALGTLTNVGGVWTFTSAPGVSGPVVINYTIVDQDGATDSATHTVNVTNQPPVPPPPPPPPAPPPAPPPPPPVPRPEEPNQPSWGERPVNELPAGPALPPIVNSALHVLFAVGGASAERGLFASSVGQIQVGEPLMGEAMAQVPDSLLFDSSTRGADQGLIRERAFGEVQTFQPALYVQSAVRHQPITTDPSLWVQHAVRSSQLESQLRAGASMANNSATPGYSTLIDPFALGAPKPEGSPVVVAEAETPDTRQDAVARAPVNPETQEHAVKNVVDTAENQLVKPRAAVGLRSQLERFAKDRVQSARPVTRTSVSS